MKTKFLFWAVVAAMAVTGCSQNEVLETRPDTNRTIGFECTQVRRQKVWLRTMQLIHRREGQPRPMV